MKSNDVFQNELKDLDHERAFEFYLGAYYNDKAPKPGQLISNPFLSKKQKTPSFNYFQTDAGDWRYKDFSTDDQGGIIFLVKRLFNLDYRDAIAKIQTDFLFGQRPKEKNYSINKDEWTNDNLKYWKSYRIPTEILERYKVYPIQSIINNKGEKNQYVVKGSENDPIFGYQINEGCSKSYRPLNSKFKFSWLGKKPTDYIFGLKQLPESSDRIYIAAGEKDVLSLASIGCDAVCFNSETAIPSEDVVQKLKRIAKKLIVLYDNDETGIKQSEKLAKLYGLSVLMIPDNILLEGEKDISDVLRRGVDFKSFCNDTKDFKVNESSLSPNESLIVDKLLLTRMKLFKRMKDKIVMPTPLVKLKDIGVIYPRTINIIQGKAGVHKSRLAEILCASLITNDPHQDKFLSFKRNSIIHPTVLYVDTERNLTHQYPYALQQIQKNAGFEQDQVLEQFDCISILEIPRADRFKAIDAYLKKKRSEIDGALVVILDVITDCIKDFNRSEDSMELIDLLNSAINQHDVTFIALIHENPGVGDKARGHLGTELMNKASTVIQIGFEKDGKNKPTDLIALNFLKTRASRKPETTYVKFCEERKTLVLASDDDVSSVYQERKQKAKAEKVISYLEENYKESFIGSELIQELSEWFSCSDRTVKDRVNKIVENKLIIQSKQGEPMFLVKKREGKSIVFKMMKAFA